VPKKDFVFIIKEFVFDHFSLVNGTDLRLIDVNTDVYIDESLIEEKYIKYIEDNKKIL